MNVTEKELSAIDNQPTQMYNLYIPAGKPFYYYAQIERFNRNNILPQMNIIIKSAQSGGDIKDGEISGETSNTPQGLYGYFERTIDSFMDPRLKNTFSDWSVSIPKRAPIQYGDIFPINEEAEAEQDLIKPSVSNTINEFEVATDVDVTGDDDMTDVDEMESTTTDIDSEIDEPDDEKSANAEEFIKNKLVGTKLYYFINRNKEIWI